MKKYVQYLSFAVLGSFLAACGGESNSPTDNQESTQDSFTINGKITHPKLDSLLGVEKVIFQLAELDRRNHETIDTLEVGADGSFSITHSQEKPSFYYLQILKQGRVLLAVEGKETIALEATSVEDAGSRSGFKFSSVVSGSPASELYQDYEKARVKANEQYIYPLYEEYSIASKAKDDARMKELDALYEQNDAKVQGIMKEYIGKMGTSMAVWATHNRWDGDDMAFLNDLDNKFKALEGDAAKSILEKVNRFKSIAIGGTAPDIKQATPEGGEMALSELRGKYVLVDFWASWCGPCRQENPNVVATYEKYKDKDFTIFGVSLDKDKEKWMKAIEDDKLTWGHVSDLKGWAAEPAYLYNVNAIPANFLLDKEGKVVATNLRGEDLEKAVEKLVNGEAAM